MHLSQSLFTVNSSQLCATAKPCVPEPALNVSGVCRVILPVMSTWWLQDRPTGASAGCPCRTGIRDLRSRRLSPRLTSPCWA